MTVPVLREKNREWRRGRHQPPPGRTQAADGCGKTSLSRPTRRARRRQRPDLAQILGSVVPRWRQWPAALGRLVCRRPPQPPGLLLRTADIRRGPRTRTGRRPELAQQSPPRIPDISSCTARPGRQSWMLSATTPQIMAHYGGGACSSAGQQLRAQLLPRHWPLRPQRLSTADPARPGATASGTSCQADKCRFGVKSGRTPCPVPVALRSQSRLMPEGRTCPLRGPSPDLSPAKNHARAVSSNVSGTLGA